MYVPNEAHEISRVVHQDGFKPPLKEMSNGFELPVAESGIAEGDVLKDLRQGNSVYLYRQVDVVGHKAKSQDPMTVSFDPFLK